MREPAANPAGIRMGRGIPQAIFTVRGIPAANPETRLRHGW